MGAHSLFSPKEAFKMPSSSFVTYDGILSPALSAATATSLTPITPMTPLTTPRTPAQALLGSVRHHHYRRGGEGEQVVAHYAGRRTKPSHASSTAVSCATYWNDEDDRHRERQLLALQVLENFLLGAESILEDVTRRENSGYRVVGPGLLRACHDLAETMDTLANELRDKQLEGRRLTIHETINNGELTLFETNISEEVSGSEGSSHSLTTLECGQNHAINARNATEVAAIALSTLANEESNLSDEEMYVAVSNTYTLLTDMASALRSVTPDEAQELGEVILKVAHMFIWFLHIVHQNMIQMVASSECSGHTIGSTKEGANRVTRFTGPSGLGPLVEIIGEEEKKDEFNVFQVATPPKSSARYAPQLSPVPSSPLHYCALQQNDDRLRILWPPLLPAVTEATKYCASSAIHHPMSAVAIGLTCWPAAIATAFVAPSVLAADWAIQSSYNALSDTPVIETVEKGAANAFQVARLAIVCSKMAVKQSISVGESQIKRHGGLGQVCSEILGGAVDMALHPVETVGMAWEGLFWIGDVVKDAVGFVKEAGDEWGIPNGHALTS